MRKVRTSPWNLSSQKNTTREQQCEQNENHKQKIANWRKSQIRTTNGKSWRERTLTTKNLQTIGINWFASLSLLSNEEDLISLDKSTTRNNSLVDITKLGTSGRGIDQVNLIDHKGQIVPVKVEVCYLPPAPIDSLSFNAMIQRGNVAKVQKSVCSFYYQGHTIPLTWKHRLLKTQTKPN